MPKHRALISVSDKTGIVNFASALADLGYELISTGGTARLLTEAGLKVTPVSEVTGSPEMLDGRVKTLHPAIHGGILALRDSQEHLHALEESGFGLIDMVVVNLYPFGKVTANPECSLAEAIENIDIGGPAMIRSAAKNHQFVSVVIDAEDYQPLIDEMKASVSGAVGATTRRKLAIKAFQRTSEYDAAITEFLAHHAVTEACGAGAEDSRAGTGDCGAVIKVCGASAEAQKSKNLLALYPDQLSLRFAKVTDLRYGENPHQTAAFYREVVIAPAIAPASAPDTDSLGMAAAEQLWGKELSFNNIQDADAALSISAEFAEPAAVAVKHANPCGVALGETPAQAFQRVYEADPVSIFGGIVALNRVIDAAAANEIAKVHLDVLLAPGYSEAALSKLKTKKNMRIIAVPDLGRRFTASTRSVTAPSGSASPNASPSASPSAPPSVSPSVSLSAPTNLDYRRVQGGLLVQSWDHCDEPVSEWKCVTKVQAAQEFMADLAFAWQVAAHVKSNAIVLVKNGMTIGIGGGQTNRIDAARIAINTAGEKARRAVMASDGFFPFDDVVLAAAAAGIAAIVQPGGSIRDELSIKAAEEAELPMYFTGVRHFRH